MASFSAWRSSGWIQRGAMKAICAALILAACSATTWAQASKTVKKPANENQKVPGKITDVEMKGKVATFIVEKEGGEKQEVTITPKMAFGVVGKGDVGFFRPGLMVSTTAVMSPQMQLYGKEYTVYIGTKPPAKVAQNPSSPMVYDVCGLVTAADEDSVTLNFGPRDGTRKVFLEKDALVININSNDASLVKAGAEAELEGLNRAGKFLPTGLMVTLAEPLTADEVFPDPKTKAAAKPATASSKTTAKTATTKDAPAAGGAAADTNDPFGVLKKKDDKAKPAAEKKP